MFLKCRDTRELSPAAAGPGKALLFLLLLLRLCFLLLLFKLRQPFLFFLFFLFAHFFYGVPPQHAVCRALCIALSL